MPLFEAVFTNYDLFIEYLEEASETGRPITWETSESAHRSLKHLLELNILFAPNNARVDLFHNKHHLAFWLPQATYYNPHVTWVNATQLHQERFWNESQDASAKKGADHIATPQQRRKIGPLHYRVPSLTSLAFGNNQPFATLPRIYDEPLPVSANAFLAPEYRTVKRLLCAALERILNIMVRALDAGKHATELAEIAVLYEAGNYPLMIKNDNLLILCK